jgi:hypothetical protein
VAAPGTCSQMNAQRWPSELGWARHAVGVRAPALTVAIGLQEANTLGTRWQPWVRRVLTSQRSCGQDWTWQSVSGLADVGMAVVEPIGGYSLGFLPRLLDSVWGC